ncbi:hypothetical protein GCM10020229_27310 [Kitasatospora albolonga]
MSGNRIIHRTADGVRIPGTWRHVFICNGGQYFLTDLFVYADGLVDCWGLVTFEEFEEKLRTGWVATTLPEGGEASAHELADWTFGEPESWLTPEELAAEVRDTIEELNGRPDSTGRCLAAVDAFLADRTEENRAVARAAYLAIPETQRHFALGDMDAKDWPLRVLVAGPGGRVFVESGEVITKEGYDEAVAYFEDRARRRAERAQALPADGPVRSYAPAVQLGHWFPARAAGRSRQARPAPRLPRPDHGRGRGPPVRRARLLGAVGRRARRPSGDLGCGERRRRTHARGRGGPSRGLGGCPNRRHDEPAARQVRPAPRAGRDPAGDGRRHGDLRRHGLGVLG